MKLTFDDYRKMALETAVYPELGSNPYYVSLGLCGESRELFAEIYKYDNVLSITTARIQLKDNIIKEAGDVLWYAAMIANEMNIDNLIFEDISTLVKDIHKYSIDIMSNSCRIAEHMKKVMRDHGGDTNIIKHSVYCILDQILINISTIAYLIGVDIETIAMKNYNKLKDRMDRNKINGSGGNR